MKNSWINTVKKRLVVLLLAGALLHIILPFHPENETRAGICGEKVQVEEST